MTLSIPFPPRPHPTAESQHRAFVAPTILSTGSKRARTMPRTCEGSIDHFGRGHPSALCPLYYWQGCEGCSPYPAECRPRKGGVGSIRRSHYWSPNRFLSGNSPIRPGTRLERGLLDGWFDGGLVRGVIFPQ